MSLIRKADVKNHLSTRTGRILPFKPSSKADVTDPTGTQRTDAKSTVPVADTDRRAGALAAPALTLPADGASEREASAPATRSGKPTS